MLRRERDESRAAIALQARARGRQAQLQRAELMADRQAQIEQEVNTAATVVQSRLRVQLAMREREARFQAHQSSQREAAVALQSSVRGRFAQRQANMLRYERDLPEEERRSRADAASRLAAANRARQARSEYDVRRQERDRVVAERAEAARALQSLIRVRQARQQRKMLEDAAELSSVLGISKWAALWMLRSQDIDQQEAKEVTEEITDAQKSEPNGAWDRLTSAEPPPATASVHDEELDVPDVLSPPEEPMLDDPQAEADVRPVLADVLQPTVRNRHWQLLVNNLRAVVDAMRAAAGLGMPDPAGAFAHVARERQSQLQDFRRRNQQYPHGPLPAFGDSRPQKRSPRHARPASRGVVQQTSARQGPLGASRSEASLVDRPSSSPSSNERLPQYGELPQPLYGAARDAQARPPMAAWGASEPGGNEANLPSIATGTSAQIRQQASLLLSDLPAPTTGELQRAGLSSATRRNIQRFQTSEPSYPDIMPTPSPSMPTLPAVQQRRTARQSGNRSDSPPQEVPRRERQLRPVERKASNERLPVRANRRPARMPGAPPAAADPFLSDTTELPPRPYTSDADDRPPPAATSAASSRPLRASSSQYEVREIPIGPAVGSIRSGPSLLSEMPLPFDVGQIGPSRAAAPGPRRDALQATTRAQIGASTDLPGLPRRAVPTQSASPGPSYGEHVAHPNPRVVRDRRRETSPPRTYQV